MVRWSGRVSFVAIVMLAGALAVAAYAGPKTFTSAGPITISDGVRAGVPDTPSAASPSPSVINVPGDMGTVSKATVTLHGLEHSCPSDLRVLLVAPNGKNVVLLAHTGSCQTPTGDVTFDDAAASSFTDSLGHDAAGTWRPAQSPLNDSTVCPWPGSLVSPAPAGPYGATLASVTRGPAAGSWKLYVEDGCSGDLGTMASWSLDLKLVVPAAPGGLVATTTLKARVRLTWKPAPDATVYEVWRATSPTRSFKRLATTRAPAYVDRTALRLRSYTYRVRASNGVDQSPFSKNAAGRAR